MTVQNSEVSDIFEKVAELLAIEGANPFRIRAYQKAADTVRSFPKSVDEMIEEHEEFDEYPGIGKDLAGKIEEIVKTGHLKLLDELKDKFPASLQEVVKIPGMGPKKVKQLHEELGIKSVSDLEKMAREGKVGELKGFSKKGEKKLLKQIENFNLAKHDRTSWAKAREIANTLVKYMKEEKGVKEIEVAGSYRRKKVTVGDLDILVTCSDPKKIMKHFVAYDEVKEVRVKGDTKSSVLLNSDFQVDLRVVDQDSFGAALLYFTGSKAHNIHLRKMAMNQKFKINEYGIFKGEKRIASKTENEIYQKLGLAYIEPEMREDRGEIEVSLSGNLPKLIETKDIRGDLHSHTVATDGVNTIEEMAEEAKLLGRDYLAITDHSKRVSVAKGLNEKELEEHIERIEEANERIKGIEILKGIEVDILKNGSLDLPDRILKKLDVRVCSVHYDRNISSEKMTERIIRAMDNPLFNILGHPTGRLINRREAYEFDMEKILLAAKERGCFLEINCQPARLDLEGEKSKMARDIGVRMVISTDSHSTLELHNMDLGVGQARRGWLEKQDVLNSLTWKSLKKYFKR